MRFSEENRCQRALLVRSLDLRGHSACVFRLQAARWTHADELACLASQTHQRRPSGLWFCGRRVLEPNCYREFSRSSPAELSRLVQTVRDRPEKRRYYVFRRLSFFFFSLSLSLYHFAFSLASLRCCICHLAIVRSCLHSIL